MAEATLEQKTLAHQCAEATGIDVSAWLEFILKTTPQFVALLKMILEAWRNLPAASREAFAAGVAECDPALAERLRAACRASCQTCCEIHAAMHAAGCCA